jgi:hypothetical protein
MYYSKLRFLSCGSIRESEVKIRVALGHVAVLAEVPASK